MKSPTAASFTLQQLLKDRGDETWHQFIKIPSLRSGVYVLPAGAEDSQTPHQEDEIYYAIAGRGKLMVEGDLDSQHFDVGPGSILFVKAKAMHRFYDIKEELQLLVFFSAAQTS